jgi:crossover junction endodeoxyribonuclease RusA
VSAVFKAGPLTVTLPVPPSANRYWRTVNGHPVKSREARKYRALVDCALLRLPSHQEYDERLRLAVTVRWFRALKSGDLDNRLKVLLDALSGSAYHDDKQIVELHAYRYEDKARPRVEVTIEEVT